VIFANDAGDTLFAGTGHDMLVAGKGDDTFVGTAALDQHGVTTFLYGSGAGHLTIAESTAAGRIGWSSSPRF
jgi:Ca2+-binding RTX toxin-like protein